MATQYGIFENGIFNCKYACTKFEARKHCVDRAREKAHELEKENYYYEKFNKDSPVLVFGQIPAIPGVYIQNAVPDHDCHSFNLINATSSWYSSTLIPSVIFTISFSPIERVNIDLFKPESDLVKVEVGNRKVIRDLNDPRDALLAEIEGVVKKRSDSESKTDVIIQETESKTDSTSETSSDDEEKKSSKN